MLAAPASPVAGDAMRLGTLAAPLPTHLLPAVLGLVAGLLLSRLHRWPLAGRQIQRIGTDSLPFSHAVVHGGVVYLAGVTANADAANGPYENDSVYTQTQRVCRVIDVRLAKAGSDKSRVLQAQVWLKDIERDFAAFNKAWNEWCEIAERPVRATVQAKLAKPAMLVEIQVTASSSA